MTFCITNGKTWVEKTNNTGLEYLPYKFTAKEQDEETGLYYYGARYLDSRYSRWISTDPALGDYMSGTEAGCGGIYNSTNLSLYHYAGNNPVKYTDPDGNFINFVIGAAVGFVSSSATEIGSRMIQGQSFSDAVCNTFTDTTSLAVIGASTAIGAVTSGLSGAVAGAATTATTQLAKQSLISGTEAIVQSAAKTVAINAVAGAIDAGAKDVATKAIKGESQSVGSTLVTMGKGAASAALFSGVTQAVIASGSTSTSSVGNLFTGTKSDFNINQPEWAGSAGIIGETVIPTLVDVQNSISVED